MLRFGANDALSFMMSCALEGSLRDSVDDLKRSNQPYFGWDFLGVKWLGLRGGKNYPQFTS